jgi:hypothetical protein
MKATIFVDGNKLMLNPFMESFTANTIYAAAASLKTAEGKKVIFVLQDETLSLEVDGTPVPLNQGSAQRIVGNVLRGLLKSMHGAEAGKKFEFIAER